MKFIILVLICLTVACSTRFKLSEDEKLVNQITAQAAQKLEQEKGLVLIGTGARMMDDIKMLAMEFNYHQVVSIDEARDLLVYCVEAYLSKINENVTIRPYLHNYPFTANNIEIGIYFKNPDGSSVPLEKINIAASDEGEITYYLRDREHLTLMRAREETYEEAQQILATQNPAPPSANHSR